MGLYMFALLHFLLKTERYSQYMKLPASRFSWLCKFCGICSNGLLPWCHWCAMIQDANSSEKESSWRLPCVEGFILPHEERHSAKRLADTLLPSENASCMWTHQRDMETLYFRYLATFWPFRCTIHVDPQRKHRISPSEPDTPAPWRYTHHPHPACASGLLALFATALFALWGSVCSYQGWPKRITTNYRMR